MVQQPMSVLMIVVSAAVFFLVGMLGGSSPYWISTGVGKKLKRSDIALFSVLNCLSGGVLLSAGFVHMLPDQYEDAARLGIVGPTPMVFVLVGVLIPLLVEKSALLQCVLDGKNPHDIFEAKNGCAGTIQHGHGHGQSHCHGHGHSHGSIEAPEKRPPRSGSDDGKRSGAVKGYGALTNVVRDHGDIKSRDAKVNIDGAATASTSLLNSSEEGTVERSGALYIKLRDSPFLEATSGDRYMVREAEGCCNRGEGVHIESKGRCVTCKTVIIDEGSWKHTGECPVVLFPSQSLIGIALQPVRGQKRDLVSDLFVKSSHKATTIPYLLVLILSIHSIFAGLSYGTNRDFNSAVGLFIAIVAHKGFAAFALGMSFLQNSIPLSKAVGAIVLFSSMTPLGLVVGFTTSSLVSVTASLWTSLVFKGIAAGTFIYVSLVEILLGEFEGMDDKNPKLIGFIMGLTGMTVLGYFA